jgi:hypothetical protein
MPELTCSAEVPSVLDGVRSLKAADNKGAADIAAGEVSKDFRRRYGLLLPPLEITAPASALAPKRKSRHLDAL